MNTRDTTVESVSLFFFRRLCILVTFINEQTSTGGSAAQDPDGPGKENTMIVDDEPEEHEFVSNPVLSSWTSN